MRVTKTDYVKLPSGKEVNLYDLDLDVCKTPDDAWEVQQELQAKIIEIEYQLECYSLGYGPQGEPLSPKDPPPVLWSARAKKALAWAKLQKSDANRRFQHLAKQEKEKLLAPVRRQNCAEGIVKVARQLVDAWQDGRSTLALQGLLTKAVVNWDSDYGGNHGDQDDREICSDKRRKVAEVA